MVKNQLQDYGDIWHYVMDTVLEVINKKRDELEATEMIMGAFAELLKNNGMDIKNIPTIKET